MRPTKFNFSALAKVMEKIDDNGEHGRCGNWEMGLGGYDHGYEIYYRGAPIGRVNYEFKEYELYDEDFIPKDQIPEFLAAIDARKFKDVGEHSDDFADEDDEYMTNESIGNLETFLAEKEREFEPSGVNPSWDVSEDKAWAVQEYLSMMGRFTDEDREFLKQTDPELLSLEDEDMMNEEVDIGWDLEARRDDALQRSRERDRQDRLDKVKITVNGLETSKKYAKFLIKKAMEENKVDSKLGRQFLEMIDQAGQGDDIDMPEMEDYFDAWFVPAFAESRKLVKEYGRKVYPAANGCTINDMGDCLIVTNKDGLNIGQCRTMIEAEAIADEAEERTKMKLGLESTRKQTMWAVNFRSMHTAVHGLYYGKSKIRVQKFYKDLEEVNNNDRGYSDDDLWIIWDNLFRAYPDIETIEEFNYRDIVDLPGGYEGVEIGDTIYRFVNRTSIDVYNESTGKQKMKFRKIVNESSELQKFKRAIEAAKKSVIRDVKHHGVSENLGDSELRELRDRLFDIEHDWKNKTCSRDEEILMGKLLDGFEDWVSTYTGETVRESDGENYIGDTPKIYVGTYAKYNDGSIDGKWIDLTDYNTYEEFVAACRELHKDERDPEFMVQDYENFPEKWYHESGLPTEEEFDKINEFYMMDDDEKPAYEEYIDLNIGDDDKEGFYEKYVGKFSSMSDFGYYLVDNFGMPNENLDLYFDYEGFGRELSDYWHQGDPEETDAEGEPEDPDYYYDGDGYQQVEYGSDSEIGEQWVEDMGGIEQLGKETIERYFDYEEFGRAVMDNDCTESSGYVFWNN